MEKKIKIKRDICEKNRPRHGSVANCRNERKYSAQGWTTPVQALAVSCAPGLERQRVSGRNRPFLYPHTPGKTDSGWYIQNHITSVKVSSAYTQLGEPVQPSETKKQKKSGYGRPGYLGCALGHSPLPTKVETRSPLRRHRII